MDDEFFDEIDRDSLDGERSESRPIRLAKAEQRVRELTASDRHLRARCAELEGERQRLKMDLDTQKLREEDIVNTLRQERSGHQERIEQLTAERDAAQSMLGTWEAATRKAADEDCVQYVGPNTASAISDKLRAERDAAKAELADALIASGMNWQAYLDESAKSAIRQSHLGAELSMEEEKNGQLRADLEAARAGEARAVEMLRKIIKELCAFDVLCEGEMFGENKDLREMVEEADFIIENAQPALAWLAQDRREAAAKELERLAKDRDADTEGEEESFFRGVMTTEDCRDRAAALRAGKVQDAE